ncbi:MAG TPA: HAMP domain-containing protein, partial [Anaeromyxobacteraceae bacterium]
MTFRRRLLLSQLPLTVALLLVGGAAVRTVSRLGVSAERILQENYRSALAAQRMREALDLLDRDALLRALGRTPPEPDTVLRDGFESELRLQVANITEVGEENATLRLRSAWEDYQLVRARAASAADPASAYAGQVQDRSNGVRSAAEEILALNQAAMVRKSGLARSTARRLLAFMAGTTLVALALGSIASTALVTKTVRPLTTLARIVRQFGEGHLAARARPTGGGEIAALGQEFNTMAERLERYQKSTLGELLQAQ